MFTAEEKELGGVIWGSGEIFKYLYPPSPIPTLELYVAMFSSLCLPKAV